MILTLSVLAKEGELPLLEIVKAMNKNEVLENHSSWITKNDHVFAIYFLGICYKNMNFEVKYQYYKFQYQELLGESVFWQTYVKRFNLKESE